MKMIFNRNILGGVLALLGAIAVLPSCKKFDNPPPVFEDLIVKNPEARKILVISIDGTTGSELKTIAPPNIMELVPNAKYSFATFKSAVSTDAASWVSMVTGATYNKHLVSQGNFQPTPAEGAGEHDGVPIRRNVLDLIMSVKDTKTAFITPWDSLRNYVRIANYTPIVSTDVAVKDSTVNLLGKYSQLSTVVVNFREVEAAGANGGYVATNTVYKDAILKADGYVKEIINAVKARKTYDKEDWLIVITTNHGGSGTNPSPGFLFACHPLFKSLEMKKEGFNTVLFAGNNIIASVPNDNGLYSASNDKDFTVQAQIRVAKPSTGYVTFFSKGNGYPNSPTVRTGWAWGTWLNQWRMYHTAGFNATDQGNISDGTWHTLTTTVKRVNATTRTAQNYFDGVPSASPINWGTTNLTTAEPLRIGFRPGSSGTALEFYMANLAYFQTALDPTVIQNNLNLKNITQHPNFSSLIGFWKMDEGAEGVFQNTAPTGYDMVIGGPYAWSSLGTNSPSQSTVNPSTGAYSFQPSSADIGALMMYWLNVKVLPDYDISGKPFIKEFEPEFIK
ncbi:DUF4983 domain-containing protein [Pedobacter heparinus]|uniref:DUF4983 domain-containing protein n=1 Tax=Pedobacter heparinus TaxID=984 RepID=UPI002931143D|nr:DUF4983 domain-containing protein [Pedobacter heparinus]